MGGYRWTGGIDIYLAAGGAAPESGNTYPGSITPSTCCSCDRDVQTPFSLPPLPLHLHSNRSIVEVAAHETMGVGLKAVDPIKAGDVIVCYGEVIGKRDADLRVLVSWGEGALVMLRGGRRLMG